MASCPYASLAGVVGSVLCVYFAGILIRLSHRLRRVGQETSFEAMGGSKMVNRLVASIATACAVVSAGSALAQDLPKQSFKVVGTWSNLTNWQQNEQPF